MITLDVRGRRRAEALDRLSSGYAAHFVNDCEGAPSDANLASVLAGCVRSPRAEDYPAIRVHVARFRAERAARVTGLRFTWDGAAWEVVLVHQGVTGADGTRGLPVHAVRSEGGALVPGLGNLAAFVLNAGEAISGNAVPLAKR